MKHLSHYLFYSFAIVLFSCSTESIGDAIVEEEISEEEAEYTATEPCDFDLSTVEANSTTVINCILDLNGETITLPADVNFDFEGGDITNGKLVFSGGIIDGRLLSSKLEIEGEVKLKDPEFKLTPSRWEIVQGQTTSEIAQKNNNELERVMFMVHGLKGTTFKIDKLDAYFEISKVTSTTTNQNWYPSIEAVNIPSDFHLMMTDNTFLRVQPSGFENKRSGALLAVRDVSNVKVTGGTLFGDREQYIYSDGIGNNEEGHHLFKIQSGSHITLDGVKLINGSVGGVDIHSIGFTYQAHYKPTNNIVIRNCLFENIRRTSLVITDGRNILVENNTFIRSAQPTQKSAGGSVGFAINIEPERYRDENGDLIEYQKVVDVVIRGNIEKESRVGFITLTIGQKITVEENISESKIVYSFVNDSKIRNNTMTASAETANTPAITTGGSGETVFNNEISGNKISGYGLAIALGNRNVKVFNNELIDNKTGIQFKNITDMEVYDNEIISTVADSRGIQAHLTYVDRVSISNNRISVKGHPIYSVALNQEVENENFEMMIEGNTFEADKSAIFSKSKGVSLQQNIIKTGIQLINASTISITNNTIEAIGVNGVQLGVGCQNIEITDNDIKVATGYDCVKETEGSIGVNVVNNTCN